jgi:hypothetical protein
MSSKRSFTSKINFFSKPVFGFIYWRHIRILDGVNLETSLYKEAVDSAKRHPEPNLPAFKFSESKAEWVLLYNLAREGQIAPNILRNMRRADLYYLAGHIFPHPALTQPKDKSAAVNQITSTFIVWDPEDVSAAKRWDEAMKLQGNATRAKTELERRNFVWSSLFVVLGAIAGGFLGSGFWK